MKKVAKDLGEDLKDDEIEHIFQKADLDDDGFVTLDDFYNIMTHKVYWDWSFISWLNFMHTFLYFFISILNYSVLLIKITNTFHSRWKIVHQKSGEIPPGNLKKSLKLNITTQLPRASSRLLAPSPTWVSSSSKIQDQSLQSTSTPSKIIRKSKRLIRKNRRGLFPRRSSLQKRLIKRIASQWVKVSIPGRDRRSHKKLKTNG